MYTAPSAGSPEVKTPKGTGFCFLLYKHPFPGQNPDAGLSAWTEDQWLARSPLGLQCLLGAAGESTRGLVWFQSLLFEETSFKLVFILSALFC